MQPKTFKTLILASAVASILAGCKTTSTPSTPTLSAIPTKPKTDTTITMEVGDTTIAHSIEAAKSTVARPMEKSVSNAGYGEAWWGSDAKNFTQRQIDRSLLQQNIDMGIASARSQGLDGSGVKLAILDVGIQSAADVEESRIESRIGFDHLNSNHGNSVATVAAGTKNGVASRATIIDAVHNMTTNTTQPVLVQASKLAPIVNWSGGSAHEATQDYLNEWEVVNSSLPNMQKAIKENGTLLVQATGNAGWKNPLAEALTVSHDPELAKGYILVTATNSTKDNVLANENGETWANACGLAKDYCMTAPALYTTRVGKTSVYTEGGTSTAAPRVAGTAVLIKQKYPWADNNLLRHALLTTATDMGDKDKFGWGMLNIADAINGPKSLPWGDLAVNVTPAQNGETVFSFSNDITGSGSLTKTGSATLNLDGKNTFTGGINAKEGKLNVNVSYTGTVNVTGAGTVGGEGVIRTLNVTNGGSAYFGDGLVVGDYSTDNTATTSIRLGGDANKGLIAGKANLDGRLDIKVSSKDQSTLANEHKQVLAISNRAGKFSEVVAPVLFTSAVSYTDQGIDVTMTKKDGTQVLNSFVSEIDDVATRAVKAGADKAYKLSSTTNTEELTNLYNSNDTKQVLSSLYSMSDALHGNARNISMLQAGNLSNQLQDEVKAINNANKDGLSIVASYSNGETKWTPGNNTTGNNDLETIVAGIAYTTGDMTYGLTASKQDATWTEAFGGESTGKAKTKTTGLQAHWTQNQADNTTISVTLAGYDMQGDNERYNTLLGKSTITTADVDGKLFQASVKASKSFKAGGAALAVGGGARLDYMKLDAYHEKGNTAYAVSDHKRDELVPVVGLDATATKTFGTRLPVHALVGIGVEYDTTDRIIADGSWELDQFRYKANGSLGVDFTDTIAGFVSGEYIKSSDMKDSSAAAGVVVKF